jgi:hypothetical protein
MYSISRKYDYQQPQSQADSVQLSLEWNGENSTEVVKQCSSQHHSPPLSHEPHLKTAACVKSSYVWLFPALMLGFALFYCFLQSLVTHVQRPEHRAYVCPKGCIVTRDGPFLVKIWFLQGKSVRN